MKRAFLSLVSLLSAAIILHAQQETCHTEEAVHNLRARNPAYEAEMAAWKTAISRIAQQAPSAAGSRAQLYTIPIVFHIILTSQSQINSVRSQIAAQLATMNRDFRKQNSDTSSIRAIFQPLASDIEIEFCLAVRDPNGATTTGIQERVTTHAAWDPDAESDDMKFYSNGGLDAWNTNKYVNVWIVDIAGGSSSGIAGYAYIGSQWIHGEPVDGIVLDYSLGFGSNDRSLSHEMGHYFGLLHTWGDGGCSDDDGISDTPESGTANYGCNYNSNTCNTGSGDLPDQIENYMDYSNCPAMFTIEQKTVMRNLLTGARASLITSNLSCQAVNAKPDADFSASSTNVCPGSVVTFTDNSLNVPTSWAWTFQGGTPPSSAQQNPAVAYSAAGVYNVTLTAANAYGSDTETKTGFITVGTGGTQTLLWENFEGTFPGTWNISNPDNGITWESAIIAGSLPGSKAARVNCFNYQNAGQRDGLISPVINLSASTQVSLTFNYAHRRYSTNETDSLIVYASSNGGTSYQRVFAKAGGSGFATGYLIQQDFVPASASDWCAASATGVTCPVIDLASFSGQAGFRLKFEIVNDFGNNIYVDNVLLTGVCSAPPPSADFTANNTSGCNAVTVSFSDLSTNNPTSWIWQFTGGSPGSSAQQNPTVAYNNPGSYSVTLTVSNANGNNTKTVSGYINVYDSPSAAIAKTDVSCFGFNNGTASLTVIGGTAPFSYSWSNSSTAQNINNLAPGTYSATVMDTHQCSAQADATISQPASLQVFVNATDASCFGESNGSATAGASGGTMPYNYLWSNGIVNSAIGNLAAGVYGVTLTDANGCIAAIQVVVTQPAQLAVTASPDVTIAAGGSANLGATGCGTCASYSWIPADGLNNSNIQNPVASPTVTTTYTVTAADGNGCTASDNVQVTVNAVVAVSGKIRTETGQAVPAATVGLSGDGANSFLTGSDGNYSFNIPTPGNYTITPSKNNDVSRANGITTLDILLIQNQILSIQNLSSPYKRIAADVNRSSSVTTIDIVLIRAVVLATTQSFPGERLWAFVSSDFVFANPQAPYVFDDYRSYVNLDSSATDENFIAVKLGDVNNSWNPAIPKSGTAGEVHFKMEEYSALPGDEIIVPVRVNDFDKIAGYQFTLSWDEQVLSLHGVDNISLNGHYGMNRISEGLLTTSWNDDQSRVVTLNDEAVAFELRFKVIGGIGSSSAVSIGSKLSAAEAYNKNFEMLNIIPSDGMIKVRDAGSPVSQDPTFGNLSVRPNPFGNSTSITFSLPQDEIVSIEIYDLFGRRVKFIRSYYKKGEHSFAWHGDDDAGNAVSTGLYHVRLVTGSHAEAVKAVMTR